MKNPSVLIIEDDVELNFLYELQLRNSGLSPLSVYTLTDALCHLQSGFMPDAIVLDLQLLSGTGLDILAYLEITNQRNKTWVAVVSANRDLCRETIESYNPDCVLMKPISPKNLTQVIKSGLRGMGIVC